MYVVVVVVLNPPSSSFAANPKPALFFPPFNLPFFPRLFFLHLSSIAKRASTSTSVDQRSHQSVSNKDLRRSSHPRPSARLTNLAVHATLFFFFLDCALLKRKFSTFHHQQPQGLEGKARPCQHPTSPLNNTLDKRRGILADLRRRCRDLSLPVSAHSGFSQLCFGVVPVCVCACVCASATEFNCIRRRCRVPCPAYIKSGPNGELQQNSRETKYSWTFFFPLTVSYLLLFASFRWFRGICHAGPSEPFFFLNALF